MDVADLVHAVGALGIRNAVRLPEVNRRPWTIPGTESILYDVTIQGSVIVATATRLSGRRLATAGLSGVVRSRGGGELMALENVP